MWGVIQLPAVNRENVARPLAVAAANVGEYGFLPGVESVFEAGKKHVFHNVSERRKGESCAGQQELRIVVSEKGLDVVLVDGERFEPQRPEVHECPRRSGWRTAG